MSSWPEARCFGDVWTDAVATNPDNLFLRFEAPSGAVREWSYADFDSLVGRVAARLVGHGVAHGAAVHLALTNCPAFVAAWIATIRLGAWVVPSDPMGRTAELAGHIERTRPSVTIEQLLDWCNDRLTQSKRPRDITFVDELPRTSVGKIRKFLLKDPTAGTTSSNQGRTR